MATIDEIKAPITEELKVFQKEFRGSVRTQVPLLNAVNSYLLRKKGKQLRPVVVLLSAQICGEITSRSYTAATLVELFHTATLVHDDVVDEAQERRGIFSINAIWKSKIAVLTGDFLLSRSMLVALENEEYKLLEIISTAVKEISEGELLQLDKSRKQNTSQAEYFSIIEKKTASLFAACAAAGAASSIDNKRLTTNLLQYGKNLGMAFQMQDDLLDFDRSNRLGKLLYNDLKERKMTLPFIYALEQAASPKSIIKLFKKKKKTRQELEQLAQFIVDNGGVNYTQQQMEKYRDLAISYLVDFPQSDAKTALTQLAHYATLRKK